MVVFQTNILNCICTMGCTVWLPWIHSRLSWIRELCFTIWLPWLHIPETVCMCLVAQSPVALDTDILKLVSMQSNIVFLTVFYPDKRLLPWIQTYWKCVLVITTIGFDAVEHHTLCFWLSSIVTNALKYSLIWISLWYCDKQWRVLLVAQSTFHGNKHYLL